MIHRSLSAQIAEVEREIAMRKRVYPRQVSKRMMKQGEADEHLLLMENVLVSLRTLEITEPN
jgi:hypothetical protein